MGKGRLEAFSDGVIAIIITIMVLELKVPHGDDAATGRCSRLIPVFLSYVLSFVLRGHLLEQPSPHAARVARLVNGAILWANLHLLFWLSLVPFVDGVDGREPLRRRGRSALYGFVLLMAGLAYYDPGARPRAPAGKGLTAGPRTRRGRERAGCRWCSTRPRSRSRS